MTILRRLPVLMAFAAGLAACSGIQEAKQGIGDILAPAFGAGPDNTVYRQVTLAGLSRGVRESAIPNGEPIEVTAPVDGRFPRQIIVDLRLGEGQALSRRQGDCIQVLLPLSIDQNKFDSGRYLIRGIYRRVSLDPQFEYEKNRYEPSCGDAYLFARSMVRAS